MFASLRKTGSVTAAILLLFLEVVVATLSSPSAARGDFGSAAFKASEAEHWRAPANCGVASCYILLRLKARQLSYDDVSTILPVTSKGSSFYDIQRACRQLGLGTQLVKLSPSSFDTVRLPAIAHLSGSDNYMGIGHYLVVIGSDAHHIHFIDPSSLPAEPAAVLRGDFFRLWSGYLLIPEDQFHAVLSGLDIAGIVVFSLVSTSLVLISIRVIRIQRFVYTRAKHTVSAILLGSLSVLTLGCSPDSARITTSQASRSSTRFDLTAWKTEHDVGFLPATGEVAVKFPIENTGAISAQLQLGQPSCQCTSANLEKTALAPGEATQLTMHVSGEHNSGPLVASVGMVAVDETWANTFIVRAIAMGVHWPQEELTLAVASEGDASVTIKGTAYIPQPSCPCRFTCSLHESRSNNLLIVDPPQISEARQERSYYCRDVSVRVSIKRYSMPSSNTPQSYKLRISSSVGGRQTVDAVAIRLPSAL
jgi:Peptidase C39 family/Protein of unknown function (DUF1573)